MTKKTSTIRVQVVSIFIVLVMILASAWTAPAYAEDIDYTKQENRYAQNQIMNQQCENLNPELYKDKYLSEMVETKRTPLTEAEQKNIQDLAEQIIEDSNLSVWQLTDLDKLRLFHDWITEHFYYYSGEGVTHHPADLYDMYVTEEKGRVKTWCNGYSAMLVALARSQGIPATSVGGHYVRAYGVSNDYQADEKWVKEAQRRDPRDRTHWWTIAYVYKDGKNQWVQIDCNADCYNSFSTGDYTSSLASTKRKYGHVLFAPDLYKFSRTHIIWSIRLGSRDLKFFTDEDEIRQLGEFLEYCSGGMSNGMRVSEDLYNVNDVTTWFSDETKSQTNGAEKLLKLYFPTDRGIAGKLTLQDFEKLQNIKISRNRITELNLYNCPSLSTIAAVNCRLKSAEITNAGKITLLNLNGNPLTSVKYSFRTNKKATLSATAGGTINVRYYLTDTGKSRHALKAIAKPGYTFKGWYRGSTKVSSKKYFVSTRSTTFNYTAKFVKKKSR